MATLIDYLTNLNTSENQWGLWVNPENVDEFRVGQHCFENGGLLDNWVCVGSLDELSCGYQSTYEAIESFLDQGSFEYKGCLVRFNKAGLLEAYSAGNLDNEFQSFLEGQAEEIKVIWAEEESWNFVHNKLPEILEAAKEAVAY